MRAAGVMEDGRKVVVISVAEAREMLMRRLAMGRDAFPARRKDTRPRLPDHAEEAARAGV